MMMSGERDQREQSHTNTNLINNNKRLSKPDNYLIILKSLQIDVVFN